MDNTKQSTVLSFCSGYGGLERGLDLAGVNHRVLAYVEIEAFAIANLVGKMESGKLGAAPVYTDLKTFPSSLFRDSVDIITGGYPCQPFSTAGKRAGAGDSRHLWPYIWWHIAGIRPGRVFLENVEGHISLGLSTVISDLEDLGYKTTWGIFSAAEVGAPHQRKRVYIMGDSQGIGWKSSRKCGNGAVQPTYRQANIDDGRNDMADSQGINSRAGFCENRQVTNRGQFTDSSSAVADSPCGRLPDRLHPRTNRRAKSREQTGTRSAPESVWTTEPNVGRVVDGCPNRVDRIRLLGNGVVPQTAAKAWDVLSVELSQDALHCIEVLVETNVGCEQ